VDLTVCVATYGDRSWINLAEDRAMPSAAQPGVAVAHCHARTLHEARAQLLNAVATPWVCFLDADDELEPGYFEHMSTAVADIRVPAVRYVTADNYPGAYFPRVAGHRHDCTADCLPYGNWIVIGAVVRTELAQQVGWREWACYEDWDFWLRCWQAGATVERVPTAVYRAHVRAGSRNRAGAPEERLQTHRLIAAANGVPIP
jgi:GT2 family glycosyltransferase